MARSTTCTGSLDFATLRAVVLPLLSLPSSNADSESVFGGEEIDIECRTDLSQETICSLLRCKLNMGDACYECQASD